MLGQLGRSLLPPGDHQELVDFAAAARRSGRTMEKRIHLNYPDKTLYLLLKTTALKDDTGQSLGMVTVIEDLTELERAQRQAAWREVARAIAHEVKNPLTPIKLAAQRLRRRYLGKIPDDGKVFDECTQVISDQVDVIKNLVNEFSRFARLPHLALAPHDLNALVRDALTLYQEVQPRVSLTFQPDPALAPVTFDQEQMKRVLLNLVDNALAAIPDTGAVTLSVHGEPEAARVRVEIADTGVGIPEPDKARVFEPYFSTKRGGTGLGLAIVQSIIAEHQGHIRVEDNAPRGTRVIIELPMHQVNAMNLVGEGAKGQWALTLPKPPPPILEYFQLSRAGDRARLWKNSQVGGGVGRAGSHRSLALLPQKNLELFGTYAATILLVDDEPQILQALSGLLQDEEFEVLTAPDGETALRLVREAAPDLVMLDIALPGRDGLEILKDIKDHHPALPVIMISAFGSVENAVRATRLGAYDFIEKPPHADKILLSVRNALEMARLADENRLLRQQAIPAREIIGQSAAINEVRDKLRLVAPTAASVLITGENGTGKELVARALHYQSRRAHRPFVEVNCAAIPDDLIESELFGHEKGSFTGATSRRQGKFDLAHEGTLFLDEIGDMSLKTQAKILRILEEQRFERVGGSRPIQVDVRVVAATNKNLEKEITKGNFREDLYHRINVIPLHVPPLRDRREDIPLLVNYFLGELARENQAPPKTLTPRALEALANRSWPGNVRELKNFIWRVSVLTLSPVIDAGDLPLERDLGTFAGGVGALLSLPDFREARARFEREYLKRKLEEHKGSVSATAEAIGLERSHLYRKLRAYGLDAGREGEG